MKTQAFLTGTSRFDWRSFLRGAAPIAVLVFVSPVMAELLMGVVHLTNLWLLIPEMAVYGTAALLIREAVRRTGRGWGTLLLLGIAYAIAEECVILQTSLTPQFFPPGSFGWADGVQWIYLVALVWYESVYAIVLPIYLTEMLFPNRRETPWLSWRGLVTTGFIFVLSSVGVWELWHRAGLQKYGSSTYQVPWLYVVVAVLVIAALAANALMPRKAPKLAGETRRRVPAPWLVGVLAFGFGLAWFLLIVLVYVPASALRGFSPAIPIAAGLMWLGIGLWILRRISTAAGWRDTHRLALIFGMSLASMLGGTATVLRDAPVDIFGKFTFDLIAIFLFIWFALRLRSARQAG